MMDNMTCCMRSLALSIILLLFAVLPTMACTVPPNYIELARQIMLQINQERARFHLPEFRMSSQLTKVAQAHAFDDANHNRLSHIGTSGSSLGARALRNGYDFRFITENVALGYSTHEQVLRAWLQSSSHRKNILDGRTNELGVAVALGRDGRMHWVMNGGRR